MLIIWYKSFKRSAMAWGGCVLKLCNTFSFWFSQRQPCRDRRMCCLDCIG